jgi:hypothetical protein
MSSRLPPRPRLSTTLLSVTFAIAVASAGCGGGETTTTVAATSTVTTTTTAPAGAPAPGTTGQTPSSYTGTTDQGLPIAFVVSKNAVTGIRFFWRARCQDGQVHTNSIVLRGGPIRHGAFRVSGMLETGGVAHVAGTVNGSAASGHLSRSEGSAFGTNCRATGIAWRARLQSGDPPDA